VSQAGSATEAGFEAGFAPDRHGARWSYIGALNFANAAHVLAATTAVALPADGEVDLENMGAIDSAAVAVLLALKRRAEDERKPLRFIRAPGALLALADVYGVGSILDS
jgi:phospholipid transport system transporter-binding protein